MPVRRLPIPVPGERFGACVVTGPPVRDLIRCDLRIPWRCDCGREGTSFDYNLRRFKECCTHERTRRPPIVGVPSSPPEPPRPSEIGLYLDREGRSVWWRLATFGVPHHTTTGAVHERGVYHATADGLASTCRLVRSSGRIRFVSEPGAGVLDRSGDDRACGTCQGLVRRVPRSAITPPPPPRAVLPPPRPRLLPPVPAAPSDGAPLPILLRRA